MDCTGHKDWKISFSSYLLILAHINVILSGKNWDKISHFDRSHWGFIINSSSNSTVMKSQTARWKRWAESIGKPEAKHCEHLRFRLSLRIFVLALNEQRLNKNVCEMSVYHCQGRIKGLFRSIFCLGNFLKTSLLLEITHVMSLLF